MHGNMGEWWGFGMGLSWVWMIAFWGLLAWGAVTLFRLAFRLPELAKHHGEPPALRILKERYARGEVSREEFAAMQRDLR